MCYLHEQLITAFKYRLSSQIEPIFHSHSRYEIYYFHSGKCQYVIGGKSIDLAPGDLIIMNGLREHGPVMDDRFTYIRSTVLFDGTAVRSVLIQPHSIDVLRPFAHASYFRCSLKGQLKLEFEDMLFRLQRFYSKKNIMGYQRLRNTFLELLLFIYERFVENDKSADRLPTVKEKTVQQALSYIEQYYTEDIKLEQLSSHLFVSRFYLMKIFKELTDFTVFEYIHQRRVNQAKLLLALNKELTITEISFKVGYKQPSHFTRTFKKWTGLTPEQYRKR